ncbi:MAG: ABC transporter permease, partial [Pseudomonadota bacterium]
MADMTTNQPLMAADGTPLKQRLAKAMFVNRLRAFGLVSPLLAFISLFFFLPIVILLFQGVYNDQFAEGMPRTTELIGDWDGQDLPGEALYAAVAADIREAREIDRSLPTKVGARLNREISGALSLFKKTTRRAAKMEAPFKENLIKADKKWGQIEYWHAIKRVSSSYTLSFVLKALDLKLGDDGGIEWQPEKVQIHLKLFLRTLEISLVVTLATLALGYPVAYLLATLPVRTSNLLLILVLLPFWTSILVRTTAWIAMLQG